MVKQTHVFLLFLKTGENNFYLFSKNNFLFHFVFRKQWSISIRNFKNKKLV